MLFQVSGFKEFKEFKEFKGNPLALRRGFGGEAILFS